MLKGLGHEVRLIAPEAVRPFVKPGRKNDAADAAALCEAARRPGVKFVPVKSLEQQGTLALHAARALLIKQQTMIRQEADHPAVQQAGPGGPAGLANALRSLAAEFGLVAPQGFGKLAELVAQVDAETGVPGTCRRALRALHGQLHAVRDAATELEVSIVAHARQDETARRLATIAGIGPITASLIAATVTDVGLFRRARDFAARAGLLTCASARVDRPPPGGRWLGLVPRQHSTGGKARLGRITKAGNGQIRMLLVLGATSMARRAERWNSAAGGWMRDLLARRPARLATVALANKMARNRPSAGGSRQHLRRRIDRDAVDGR